MRPGVLNTSTIKSQVLPGTAEGGQPDGPFPPRRSSDANLGKWVPRLPHHAKNRACRGHAWNHSPTPLGVPTGHEFVFAGCVPASELAGYYHRSLRDQESHWGRIPRWMPDNSPAFQRRVIAQKIEPRAGGTVEPRPDTVRCPSGTRVRSWWSPPASELAGYCHRSLRDQESHWGRIPRRMPNNSPAGYYPPVPSGLGITLGTHPATITGPFGTRNHTGDASRDGCPTIARRFNAGSAHKT